MVPLPGRVPSGGRDEGLLVLALHGRKRELKPIELSFHVCSFLLKLMLPFELLHDYALVFQRPAQVFLALRGRGEWIWLGLRVCGNRESSGGNRDSEYRISLTFRSP